MHRSARRKPHPSHKITAALLSFLGFALIGSLVLLLSVSDPVYLKQLIEDSGPVQMVGQIAITLTFVLCVFYSLVDSKRRSAWLSLSYLMLFYALREADYHYELSDHAKASQFKRFFSHEMIPLSSKLFLATIVLLFLVVIYRYIRGERHVFLQALREKLPWALLVFAWAGIAFLSQAIDQIPLFHTTQGQVFEEVFEASAEILALLAVIIFRAQIRGEHAAALLSRNP
jgi:hypothetical protein